MSNMVDAIPPQARNRLAFEFYELGEREPKQIYL